MGTNFHYRVSNTKASLAASAYMQRESVYYKSDEMSELDERYGDMWTSICGMGSK
jgi:hypothetical protein